MARKWYVKSRDRERYVRLDCGRHPFEVDCITSATIFKTKEEAQQVANSWSVPNANGYNWRVLSFVHA